MTKYTIDNDPRTKALKELEDNLQRKLPRVPESTIQDKAKIIFENSYQFALRYHKQVAPLLAKVEMPKTFEEPKSLKELMERTDLSPNMRERLENLRQEMKHTATNIPQTIFETHREGLIGFFMMDDGVSRSTGEDIVDNHILKK